VMPGWEGEPGEGQAACRADVEMIRAPPTHIFLIVMHKRLS